MRRGACRLQLASEAMSNLTENSTSLAVAQNSVPTPISIATPIDDSYGTSSLSVTVTEMPSDGAVLLADGVHPVTRRELDGRPTDWIGVSADLKRRESDVDISKLAGLLFQPESGPTLTSDIFPFTYTVTVSDPCGARAKGGCASLPIEGDFGPTNNGRSGIRSRHSGMLAASKNPIH
jgi:hypothetical protein